MAWPSVFDVRSDAAEGSALAMVKASFFSPRLVSLLSLFPLGIYLLTNQTYSIEAIETHGTV
jgi:hypothetical protein